MPVSNLDLSLGSSLLCSVSFPLEYLVGISKAEFLTPKLLFSKSYFSLISSY